MQGVITERIFDSSGLSAEILISAFSVPYWQKKWSRMFTRRVMKMILMTIKEETEGE